MTFIRFHQINAKFILSSFNQMNLFSHQSCSNIKELTGGLIIQQLALLSCKLTKIHAPTTSHVATGPECVSHRELSTFP